MDLRAEIFTIIVPSSFAILLRYFKGEMIDEKLHVIVLHEDVLRIRVVVGTLRDHPGNQSLDPHGCILEDLRECIAILDWTIRSIHDKNLITFKFPLPSH